MKVNKFSRWEIAIKRLAENSHDVLSEESKLLKNCRSYAYERTRDLVEFHLKVTSICLNEPKQTRQTRAEPDEEAKSDVGESDQVENTLQYESSSSDPPRLLGNAHIFSTIWRSRLTRPICVIILNYIIIKYAFMTWLQFEHDSIIKKWNPKVRMNSTRTEKCALPENIYDDHPEWSTRLDTITKLMDFTGNPMISVAGTSVFIFNVAFWNPTVLYPMSAVFIGQHNLRLDCFCFMLNPLSEYRKIRNELAKIIIGMIELLENGKNLHNFRHLPEIGSVIIGSRCISCNVERRSENVQFIHFLLDIFQKDLVRPSNLTSEWHKKLLKITYFSLVGVIFSNYMIWIFLSVSTGIHELSLRANQRLDIIQCQRWMPNATIIKNTIQLANITSDVDRQAYDEYDGTVANLLYLAVFVEQKYFANTKTCLAWTELSLVFAFIIMWMVTYVSTYAVGLIDKLIWLDQIERQLDSCVRLISTKRQETTCNSYQNNEDHSLKLITITYLNYLLFKGQYSKFQFTTNALMGQITIQAGELMVVCYLVATRTRAENPGVLAAGFIYDVFFINCYFLSSAYLFSKIMRVMKNISRLAACGAGQQLANMKSMMGLWRRELLDKDDLSLFFGISSLGSKIYFGKIVTFNAYVIGLLLFLFINSDSR